MEALGYLNAGKVDPLPHMVMTIPITPEIITWIESNRAELLKSPAEWQIFDPGFKQVIDAYDAEIKKLVR